MGTIKEHGGATLRGEAVLTDYATRGSADAASLPAGELGGVHEVCVAVLLRHGLEVETTPVIAVLEVCGVEISLLLVSSVHLLGSLLSPGQVLTKHGSTFLAHFLKIGKFYLREKK